MMRKRQDPQGLLLSTARSYLFNQVLSARVADGTWCVPQPGDVLNLNGTASRFASAQVDEDLLARAEAGDLHPKLAGKRSPATRSSSRIGWR